MQIRTKIFHPLLMISLVALAAFRPGPKLLADAARPRGFQGKPDKEVMTAGVQRLYGMERGDLDQKGSIPSPWAIGNDAKPKRQRRWGREERPVRNNHLSAMGKQTVGCFGLIF